MLSLPSLSPDYSYEAERHAIVVHRRTLRSCALVSRVFAPIAQALLSQHIIIGSLNAERIAIALRRDLIRVEQTTLLVIDSVPYDSRPAPAHALADQIASICTNLRRILVFTVDVRCAHSMALTRKQLPQCASTVSELGVSEASLGEVAVVGRRFRDISVGQLIGADVDVRGGPILDRLRMTWCNGWRDICTSLPSARMLSIGNAHVVWLAALATVEGLRHLSLPRLMLETEDAALGLDLVRHLPQPTLETLALSWTERSDRAPLRFIEQLVADLQAPDTLPGLRRLTLPCVYSPFISSAPTLLDMGPLELICDMRGVELVQLIQLD